MPGRGAQAIVKRALELEFSHGHQHALMRLDAAMEGHQSQHIDFETDDWAAPYSDWLDPPSPFAELLRQALRPDLPENTAANSEEWYEVVEAFGERYDLWR